MISREELLTKLQLCVDDPMWPDHVEMPKQLIRIVIEQLTRHAQGALEITDSMIEAAAKEMWNDRDARMGGSWGSRDPREVCVIQTKATARAALKAALTSTEPYDVEKTEGGASVYCTHCDHEHQLHEDDRGFHHVIRGERVPCCSVSSAMRGDDT